MSDKDFVNHLSNNLVSLPGYNLENNIINSPGSLQEVIRQLFPSGPSSTTSSRTPSAIRKPKPKLTKPTATISCRSTLPMQNAYSYLTCLFTDLDVETALGIFAKFAGI